MKMFELLLKQYKKEVPSEKEKSLKDKSISIIIIILFMAWFLLLFSTLAYFFMYLYTSSIPNIKWPVIFFFNMLLCMGILEILDIYKKRKIDERKREETRMYKMVKLLYKYNFDASSENEIERLYKYAKKLKDSKSKNIKDTFYFGTFVTTIIASSFSKNEYFSVKTILSIAVAVFIISIVLHFMEYYARRFVHSFFVDYKLECFVKDVSSLMLFPEKTKELYEKVKKDEELTLEYWI